MSAKEIGQYGRGIGGLNISAAQEGMGKAYRESLVQKIPAGGKAIRTEIAQLMDLCAQLQKVCVVASQVLGPLTPPYEDGSEHPLTPQPPSRGELADQLYSANCVLTDCLQRLTTTLDRVEI